MSTTICRGRGFSLLELMIAISIAAILGAVAVYGYQQYTVRAAAADIVSAHHNIRSAVLAQGDKYVENCDDLIRGYDRKLLNDPHAALDYGFEAVGNNQGWRPVLTICAQAGGPGNVAVVKRAYESLSAMGVAGTSLLRDTTASFSLRLTDGDKALCKNWKARSGGCGQSAPPAQAQQVQQQQQAAQPAKPAAQPTQSASPVPACPTGQVRDANGTCALPACPVDQERVGGSCVAKCPAGAVRDANGTCPPPAQPAQPADSTPACTDTYGPTCDLDFGQGMCGEAFVQEMCKQYCGLCGSSPSTQPSSPQLPAEPPRLPREVGRYSPGATATISKADIERALGLVGFYVGYSIGSVRLSDASDSAQTQSDGTIQIHVGASTGAKTIAVQLMRADGANTLVELNYMVR